MRSKGRSAEGPQIGQAFIHYTINSQKHHCSTEKAFATQAWPHTRNNPTITNVRVCKALRAKRSSIIITKDYPDQTQEYTNMHEWNQLKTIL